MQNAHRNVVAEKLHAKMAKGKQHVVSVTSEGNMYEIDKKDTMWGTICEEEFYKLQVMPGIKRRLILFPGCTVAYYLVHDSNKKALRYEVTCKYLNPKIERKLNGK